MGKYIYAGLISTMKTLKKFFALFFLCLYVASISVAIGEVVRMQSCFDENFHKVQERCGVNMQRPCKACSAANIGYDCAKQMGGITLAFTLKCSTINHRACIRNVSSKLGTVSCSPCCLERGCPDTPLDNGRRTLQTCSYLPEDEICPSEGIGCLHRDIGYQFSSEMTREHCFIDYQRCNSVFEANGKKNSGMHCSPTSFLVPKFRICCRDQSRRHNLPSC